MPKVWGAAGRFVVRRRGLRSGPKVCGPETIDGQPEARFVPRKRLAGVRKRLAGVRKRLAGIRNWLAGVRKRLAGVRNWLAGVRNRLAGIRMPWVVVRQRLAGIGKHRARC